MEEEPKIIIETSDGELELNRENSAKVEYGMANMAIHNHVMAMAEDGTARRFYKEVPGASDLFEAFDALEYPLMQMHEPRQNVIDEHGDVILLLEDEEIEDKLEEWSDGEEG